MGGLSYNKVCNVEDFADDDLRRVIAREFPHEVARFGEQFPIGREHRKYWETVMALRTFEDHGLLDGKREFLGVGAGAEPLIFCLTRHARRVVATDLYLDPGIWTATASASMLSDPGAFWPYDWNPRRLVVQHMNALDLLYEDETFDAVFSSSSIEHFGDHLAVERAMDEIFRVLRPRGIVALSTEYRLRGSSPGMPDCLIFDRDELTRHVIGERPWSLVSPLDLTVSDETLRTALEYESVFEIPDVYPYVLLRSKTGHVWTSVHIALRRKPRNPIARFVPPRLREVAGRLADTLES